MKAFELIKSACINLLFKEHTTIPLTAIVALASSVMQQDYNTITTVLNDLPSLPDKER